MKQANDEINLTDEEKRLNTRIKSAQSSVAIVAVLTLVYMLKTMISRNLDFYFSNYLSQFLIMYSDFCPGLPGSFPRTAAVLIIVVYNLIYILIAALMPKKPQLLNLALIIYALDFIMLLVFSIIGFFGPFQSDCLIDVIVHLFILLFIAVGIQATNKKAKLNKQVKE